MNIPFNLAPRTENSSKYVAEAVSSGKVCGDGRFTKLCSDWLREDTGADKVLLTTSCTHALEMAALLCGVGRGDEVILPSYTFTSTANAFAMRGCTLVFVDIRPDTMNIDAELIEAAITEKTKAVCVVHYAGVGCDMDAVADIVERHGLYLIEDAAQAVKADYKGKRLGTFGQFGCYSFHETKNYSMGEGGALLINDAKYIDRAEILREKGTDRSRFRRGQVDKYTWRDVGSSYLPSELCAAYLWSQLERADEINNARLSAWDRYWEGLGELAATGAIELPYVPEQCTHNAHMFYIKTADLDERTRLIKYLEAQGIYAVFHYVPLHSADAGLKCGYFAQQDVYTTRESERLLRLPMYYGLTADEVDAVCEAVKRFYREISPAGSAAD